jgi:uncharacterized protein YbaR (Trm112 family)
MKKVHLEKLICVECRSKDLALPIILSQERDEIIEGIIECASCSIRYPIIEGIACFLRPQLRTSEIQAYLAKIPPVTTNIEI